MEYDDEDCGETDIGCSSITIPSYYVGMDQPFVDLPAQKEDSATEDEAPGSKNETSA